ncbi:tryptophan synthase subunit alpha [Aminipila sp.]|uniref:tryptophan synthase subunit alpha n=1 Tax=Aminipila sp. TaxID=2060095 RepID=UPI002897CB1D|nr:tryptophan synthase subunit alpha [Aminipila sp.]
MNRIKDILIHNGEKQKAFVGFITAGDPTIEKTKEFIFEMIKGGADLIEIGIPFSDPIAEGPVIQAANIRALSKGIDTDKVFELVCDVRKESGIPLVFMTYLNLVFSYGYDKFFKRCEETGVDGIILPDLPFEEKKEVTEAASKYGVEVISLIAPTSENRIKMIAEEASGFVYLVSSMGVTGMRNEIKTDLEGIIKVIRENTKIPCFVGFGINTPEQAAEISQKCDGVIVGSAIVKIIEKYGDNAGKYVFDYVKSMKDSVKKTRNY